MSAMLDAALGLARVGWCVFPCDWRSGARSKAPLTDHGFYDATIDPEMIKHWWKHWPSALIGATVPTELVVLDIDPRHGGSLGELQRLAGCPMPITMAVWSGRNDGGRHLYHQRPPGPMTSTRLPDGVDLKVGGKSYMIMPPSLHPDTGKPYLWTEQTSPARLPRRIERLLIPSQPIYRAKAITSTNGSGLVRQVATAKKGNRDRALFWAACRAVEEGLIDDLEHDLVAASVSTGFPEAQAWRKIASARRTVQ